MEIIIKSTDPQPRSLPAASSCVDVSELTVVLLLCSLEVRGRKKREERRKVPLLCWETFEENVSSHYSPMICPGLFLCPGLEWLSHCNIEYTITQQQRRKDEPGGAELNGIWLFIYPERCPWDAAHHHYSKTWTTICRRRPRTGQSVTVAAAAAEGCGRFNVGGTGSEDAPLVFFFNLFKSPLNDPKWFGFYLKWELLSIGR